MFYQEVIKMSEYELMVSLINTYANLQRIITADDPKKEAERQLIYAAAILEVFGINPSDLDIKK